MKFIYNPNYIKDIRMCKLFPLQRKKNPYFCLKIFIHVYVFKIKGFPFKSQLPFRYTR